MLANLGYAYARAGDTAEARRILDQLLEPSRRPTPAPFDVALVEIGLGLQQSAIARLNAALRDGTVTSVQLASRRFGGVRSRLEPSPQAAATAK